MSERQNFAEEIKALSEEARRIEQLLASLKPRKSHVDRERLMFLAGRASVLAEQRSTTVARRLWARSAATLCSAGLGLLIGASISFHRGPVRNQISSGDTRASTSTRGESSEKTAAPIVEVAELRRDNRIDDERSIDRTFALFALHDRLRPDPDFDFALADAGGVPAKNGSAIQSAPPRGYRELMRQWLTENDSNRL